MTTRRDLLAFAATSLAAPAFAATPLPLTSAFPQKRAVLRLRSTPPLLETPFEAFSEGVFTPNDRFFVRWHYPFPTDVDPRAHRLRITGAVQKPLSLSLADLARLPRVQIAAVNQCAGNGRALFAPRVPGAQWGNGAMGNALWEGVRLRDVLDLAGVTGKAVAVRASGLDQPATDAPDFAKSLGIDHARDGEVMLAWAMNGAPLPLLNGFPLRLVVPGWYSTYWVKMLDHLEVLDRPDDGYWMAKAYLGPVGDAADVPPGTSDFAKAPVGPMRPRAFITSVAAGDRLPARPLLPLSGIAMGGDTGLRAVELSGDGGASWQPAQLGPDMGRHGFRRWQGAVPVRAGATTLLARATNANGLTQPLRQNWNPSGYTRWGVEPVPVEII